MRERKLKREIIISIRKQLDPEKYYASKLRIRYGILKRPVFCEYLIYVMSYKYNSDKCYINIIASAILKVS